MWGGAQNGSRGEYLLQGIKRCLGFRGPVKWNPLFEMGTCAASLEKYQIEISGPHALPWDPIPVLQLSCGGISIALLG